MVAASAGRSLVVDEALVVQSNHALPFSDGQGQLNEVEGISDELVVAASTGRSLEVDGLYELVVAASIGRLLEVEETVDVQSNHALPFSDGQGQLKEVEGVSDELVVAASTGRSLEVVRLYELVVAASIGRSLEVEETVDVQSSHELPFSDGHGQ